MSAATDYVVTRVSADRFNARLAACAAPQRQEGQSRGFRASSLAYCLRQTGYRLAGTPQSDPSYNPDYEMAAAQGTAIHEHVQRHLVSAGMVYTYPGFGPSIELPLHKCTAPALEPLRKRLEFSGTIDAVIETAAGELAVLDIKTVAAKYLDAGYRWTAEKLQGYAVQVGAYCHFFATPDGRTARQAFILHMSRDDTAVRALYRIDYQPERVAVELARLEAAHAAVALGDLPDPEPARGVCRFCEWRSLCPKGNL